MEWLGLRSAGPQQGRKFLEQFLYLGREGGEWVDGGSQREGKFSHSPVEFCDRLGDVCRGKLGIQVGEPTLRGISVKIG